MIFPLDARVIIHFLVLLARSAPISAKDRADFGRAIKLLSALVTSV
jgi:hypothetical protein